MSFLKKIELDFDLIRLKVEEMVGDGAPQKIEDLLVYLMEEVSYARHQWEECLKKRDWLFASKILHREKLFINVLDLFENPEIIIKIQKNPEQFKIADLRSFYTDLVMVFKKIEGLISENNGRLPV